MAKDRRCLDDQSWEVAAMASAETVMAVYSEEDKVLESRMRSKDSCPVWGEGAGKVPDGNSPTPYSTARPVLRGALDSNVAAPTRRSLTVWFTEAAVAAWEAEPRTTPGGQPHYSALAITTALTLKAEFRLAHKGCPPA